MLEQIYEGKRQPLGFYSHKLTESQTKWSTYDRELFAIYLAVEYFECLIQARNFAIITDHKPLLSMFTGKNNGKLVRRSRQIEYIAQFTSDIRHISGTSNIVADALSRMETLAIRAPITLKQIALEQSNDEEIESITKNTNLEICHVIVDENDGCTVACTPFQGKNRPIVPARLRRSIFEQIHNIAHPGQKNTLYAIRSRYYWPNMTKQIREWQKTCIKCQRSKIHRHVKSPVKAFPPSEKFEHIHTDIVELCESNGFKYACSIIDRWTKWIEIIPIKDMKAETIARAIFDNWICRYGVPYRFTSDRGAQFLSKLFEQFTQLLGAEHIKTTSYHPQSNAKVERFHKHLKETLSCYGNEWTEHLSTVLLGIRATTFDDNGISRAEAMFGKPLCLPGELIEQQENTNNEDIVSYVAKLRKSFQLIQPKERQRNFNKKFYIPKDLFSTDKVFIRVDKVKQPLEMPYEGPYTVLKRTKKWFQLQIGDDKRRVSIDRLKPAFLFHDSDQPLMKPENEMKLDEAKSKKLVQKKRVRFNFEPLRNR